MVAQRCVPRRALVHVVGRAASASGLATLSRGKRAYRDQIRQQPNYPKGDRNGSTPLQNSLPRPSEGYCRDAVCSSVHDLSAGLETQPGVEADCFQLLRGSPVPSQPVEVDVLLTPAEVAAILYVDPKTVTRWAMAGKVNCLRTPGGHRRFLRSEILALATAASSPKRAPMLSDDHRARTTSPYGLDVKRVDRGRIDSGEAGTRAAAVVAQAVTIAREAQAAETAHAVISTRFAVGSAASIAANAAEAARAGRAGAAAMAAEAVATSAGRTAAAVQRRADASATRVSEAAARAATVVVAAIPPGGDRQAALTALQLAATVQAAAVAAADDTAVAAAEVATAVAAAAAEVARRVADLDVAIEAEVAGAAAAVQTTATATARQVAAETDARANDVAMLAHEAVAARFLHAYDDHLPPDEPATRARTPVTAVTEKTRS
jgi:excisionase family DNA binding protein